MRAKRIAAPARLALVAVGAAAWGALVWREGAAALAETSAPEAPPGRPGNAAPRWLDVFRDAASRWSAHQVSRLAASLSYYTLFSVAPVVLIMVAVIGFFFGERTAQGLVASELQSFLGDEKTKALQQVLAAAQRPGAGSRAGLIGFIVLLAGASGVVGELQASLNQIFGVYTARASFWVSARRRLISIAFVLAMGFMLLVSLAVNAGTAAAGKYFGTVLGIPAHLMQTANQLASFGLISLLFAGMFRFLPDARMAWRDLGVGACFTAALFTLGNLLLGMYLGRAGPASAYGAAGSLLAFLLWTYYCAQIVYFGAEFTRSYAERRGLGLRPIKGAGLSSAASKAVPEADAAPPSARP
jgi:membrane protein